MDGYERRRSELDSQEKSLSIEWIRSILNEEDEINWEDLMNMQINKEQSSRWRYDAAMTKLLQEQRSLFQNIMQCRSELRKHCFCKDNGGKRESEVFRWAESSDQMR